MYEAFADCMSWILESYYFTSLDVWASHFEEFNIAGLSGLAPLFNTVNHAFINVYGDVTLFFRFCFTSQIVKKKRLKLMFLSYLALRLEILAAAAAERLQ